MLIAVATGRKQNNGYFTERGEDLCRKCLRWEQVRKTLAPHIEGKKILAVEIYLERLIKYPQPDAFIKGLVGKTIISVGRRGKYLVLHTRPKQQLIVHLRR